MRAAYFDAWKRRTQDVKHERKVHGVQHWHQEVRGVAGELLIFRKWRCAADPISALRVKPVLCAAHCCSSFCG